MKITYLFFALIFCSSVSFGQQDSIRNPAEPLHVQHKDDVYPSCMTFSGGMLVGDYIGYHFSSAVYTGEKRVKVGYTMGYINTAVWDTLSVNKGSKSLNSLSAGLTARAYSPSARVYATTSVNYLLPVFDKRFNARGGLGLDVGLGVYGKFSERGENVPVFAEVGINAMAFLTPTLERPSATRIRFSIGIMF